MTDQSPNLGYNKPSPSGASLSDFLTVIRQLVQALNDASLQYLNINGAQNLSVISTPTLVHTGSGRLCTVSVTTAGSAVGFVYDGNTASSTTKPIYVIQNITGATFVNLPYNFGLVIAPGTGQVVTVGYS